MHVLLLDFFVVGLFEETEKCLIRFYGNFRVMAMVRSALTRIAVRNPRPASVTRRNFASSSHDDARMCSDYPFHIYRFAMNWLCIVRCDFCGLIVLGQTRRPSGRR